jgi:hypothetical protein
MRDAAALGKQVEDLVLALDAFGAEKSTNDTSSLRRTEHFALEE